MTATEIAKLLANNAENFCKYLFPNGKTKGKEFEVGSSEGEAGHSLRIRIHGGKVGVWSDFAGNEEKGDLIGLIMLVRSCSLMEACEYACLWLGVDGRMESRAVEAPKGRKTYKRDRLPKTLKYPRTVYTYLTDERKISPEVLRQFKVYGEGEFIKFPYFANDECYLIKSISINRDEKGKKKIYATAESEPCLFGWQSLDGTEREIIITEGEIDALSWAVYGYKALSVPFGVNNFQWIETDFERLSLFDTIYIAMDNDEPGIKASKIIVQRLGEDRCRVVSLPLKDVNECLKNGIENNVIDECISSSSFYDPAELKWADNYREATYKLLHPELYDENGVKLELCGKGELIFRADETTLWTGINGHGKSLLLGQVLIDTMKQGKKICIASLEVKPERTLFRMSRQICGTNVPNDQDYNAAFDWLRDKCCIFDFVGEVSHVKLLQIFEYAHKRYGVEVFLIDSFMMLDIPEDKTDPQKKFAQKICEFARKFGVHVHIVAHPRKTRSEEEMPNKMDVSGSVMLTNTVENVLIVWRNKTKEMAIEKYNRGQIVFGDDEYHKVEKARKAPDTCLICVKNKNGEWEGMVPLWFHKESLQFLPTEYSPVIKYLEFKKEEEKSWFE